MPERILIADDQIEVQEMLADILKRRGAEVEAADDAETAVEMVCNLMQKYVFMQTTQILSA